MWLFGHPESTIDNGSGVGITVIVQDVTVSIRALVHLVGETIM